MIWKIPKQKYRVYDRNPLDTVIVQVRFEPILRISAGDEIPTFQEAVRSSFPAFAQKQIQSLEVSLPNQVQVQQDQVFQFVRKSDSCKVELLKDNISISARNHASREQLVKDVNTVTKALSDTYPPIVTTRLGVRYVNIVDKAVISAELGREVSWPQLVKDEYLRIPAGVADLESTLFMNEITSTLDLGSLTLRYGFPLPKDPVLDPSFRFDIDRYIDGQIEVSDIPKVMHQFTDDIYGLFHTFPGIELVEWMSNSDAESSSSEVN